MSKHPYIPEMPIQPTIPKMPIQPTIATPQQNIPKIPIQPTIPIATPQRNIPKLSIHPVITPQRREPYLIGMEDYINLTEDYTQIELNIIKEELATKEFEIYVPKDNIKISALPPKPIFLTMQLTNFIATKMIINEVPEWIIGILMMTQDEDSTKAIVRRWLHTDGYITNLSTDEQINLIYYMTMSSNPLGSNLSFTEVYNLTYITNNQQLLDLLGNKYEGPTDKASLIFAILSGTSAPRPNVNDIPRYNLVKNYTTKVAWILATKLYNFLANTDDYIDIYPPYIHVALQNPSILESIIVAVNEDNVDEFLNTYQIILPTLNTPRDQTSKVDYFIQEILNYEEVLHRNPNIGIIESLRGINRQDAKAMLSPYTIKELVVIYEPIDEWSNRNELITVILNDANDPPRWSWRNRYCNNNNTMNVITGELHGNTNKNDPEDPTVSYGTQRNYRCYQISELEASFRIYDGVFKFLVPDWIGPQLGEDPIIDSIIGQPLGEEFSIDSMDQLRNLLRTTPQGYNLGQLENIINTHLTEIRRGNADVQVHFDLYNKMSQNQESEVRLYLAWLFIYGMWMIFWKGPGHPWSTIRVNVTNIEERDQAQRCSPQERDEHIFIQEGVRTLLTERYEQDPAISNWINTIHTISYNFNTNQVNQKTQLLVTLLDSVALGNACMGFAGDTIVQTAYYFIINILQLRTPAAFNDFILAMFPPVLDLERQVVENQLQYITNPDANHIVTRRHQVLTQRQLELQTPIMNQPAFDPGQMQNNMHVNNEDFYPVPRQRGQNRVLAREDCIIA